MFTRNVSFFSQTPRASQKILVPCGDGSSREESAAALPVRAKSMLRAVQACGDYDKIMNGVFENYLQVKFRDTQLANVSLITIYFSVTVPIFSFLERRW